PAPRNLQILADRVLVQRFAPIGVLCTEAGDVLYISGRTGKYLEPPVGKANMNIFAMAREGLRYELSSSFAAALRREQPVIVRGVKVGTNGGTQTIDLTVQRLSQPKELRSTVMVIFAEVAPEAPPGKRKAGRVPVEPKRIVELEEEVRRAREEIQTTREE